MYTQQNTRSAQQFPFIFFIYAVLQHSSGIIHGNLKAVHTKLQAESQNFSTDQNMTVTYKHQNYIYKQTLKFTYKHNFSI